MADNNKLQEDIIKADNKEVERLWKNEVHNDSLEALLEKMTKDELVKVAKRYSIKGLTSLKKADVVERLKYIILDNYEQALETIEEDTLRFIKNLIDESGKKKYSCTDIIYSNYLRNRGIVFTGTIEDELYVILPKELVSLLETKCTKEWIEKSRMNGDIIKAIAGMIYYYGVVDFKSMKERIEKIFNRIFEDKFIADIVAAGEELGYDYVVDGDLLYHIDVENVERIIELQKENKNDYYKFDKKTLIRAGKPDFIEENKQGDKLKRVFKELFVIDNEILSEEMDSFIIAIKNEMPEDEAIENFLQAYEIESEEEKNIFKDELREYAKTIRRWTLKGYSEGEIKKNEQRIVNEVKIGRNDPCICGSGKKYKKCCG